MLVRRRSVLLTVLFSLLLSNCVLNAWAQQAPTGTPAVDPKAREQLKKMSDYMSSLQRFSVRIEAVEDGVLPSGERVAADRSSVVYVERPNKLRANVVTAAKEAQVFYDGKTFTVYTPKDNYYGSWQAPGTLAETVAMAKRRYGVSIPAADFLGANSYERLMENVQSATYVGMALVRGKCTHYLTFRQPNIDWQIWIQDGDTPVPVRVRIIDKAERGQPAYMATFTDWDVSPTFTADTFTFTPPAGAQRIAVSEVPSEERQTAPQTAPQTVPRTTPRSVPRTVPGK